MKYKIWRTPPNTEEQWKNCNVDCLTGDDNFNIVYMYAHIWSDAHITHVIFHSWTWITAHRIDSREPYLNFYWWALPHEHALNIDTFPYTCTYTLFKSDTLVQWHSEIPYFDVNDSFPDSDRSLRAYTRSSGIIGTHIKSQIYEYNNKPSRNGYIPRLTLYFNTMMHLFKLIGEKCKPLVNPPPLRKTFYKWICNGLIHIHKQDYRYFTAHLGKKWTRTHKLFSLQLQPFSNMFRVNTVGQVWMLNTFTQSHANKQKERKFSF